MAKKDTFYFSHDYNSRSDDKIKNLIFKHGMQGYGAWWSIIEDLYNNANALRTDYERIAFDLRVDVSVVKSIINDFGLFVLEGENFGSLSVQNRLDERDSKSSKARESARYRWENANAMRTQCDSNAIKERKRKEIKGKERTISALKISDESKKFAEWFSKELKPESMNPTEKDLESWAKTYDKLKKDGKTKEQIVAATKWARNDDFWAKNFQNPNKLRKKNKDEVFYIDVFLDQMKIQQIKKEENPDPNKYVMKEKRNPVTGQ